MGCISGKLDINDQHPNIFQVMNVDELGHFVSPGQLEITETELILHQRGKPPTQWPVRCLRKYGFDSEIFSFECGRRCPTGAGIYAFRCRKAEQLFNLVQHNIQIRNSADDNLTGLNVLNVNDFPVPLTTTGPPVQRRLPSVSDGYLNPSNATSAVRTHPCLSRPGSVTSNGTISPSTLSPPAAVSNEMTFEHNNNKRGSLVPEHSYTNASTILEASPPNYINLSLTTTPIASENYVNVVENTQRLYMNVDANCFNTKELPKLLTDLPNSALLPVPETTEDIKHCYANINSTDLELIRRNVENLDLYGDEMPPNTPNSPLQEVNYVELDLQTNTDATMPIAQSSESPAKVKKSYATIDFNKTNALSQSVNPRMEEEGSRKTRHNSTISTLPTRHSNSSSD